MVTVCKRYESKLARKIATSDTPAAAPGASDARRSAPRDRKRLHCAKVYREKASGAQTNRARSVPRPPTRTVPTMKSKMKIEPVVIADGVAQVAERVLKDTGFLAIYGPFKVYEVY
jgi:hypothetical protein